MKSMENTKQREVWVDNVKIIACILVVLGHFFQSMTMANILPSNDLYLYFDQTIYYFHVPLFFICSGYLYQKYSKVDDASSWGRNVLKKLVTLGVPYVTFSAITWLLKTLFSSSVNNQIGKLDDTLLFHPTAPYWYLYALFFLFLITPTFRNKTTAAVGLMAAVILKALGLTGEYSIQAISYIFKNEIWFVIGMCISVFGLRAYLVRSKAIISLAMGIIFLGLSVLVHRIDARTGFISFFLGLIACYSIISLTARCSDNSKQLVVMGFGAQYTMPIFLMHTLFAAPLRTLMLMLGIQNPVVHVALGILISFTGPIIVAEIMQKMKWAEFFLYPGKYFKNKLKDF